MNVGRSAKNVDFSAKGEPMSDTEMAANLMDEVIGARGVREPVKSMLERAYSELSKRNREWTRRRVRAVFNKEASRIEHREISEMQAVIEARKIHGAAIDKRWLNRKSLWEMFSYPFHRAGAQMVVMRVSERNVMWNGRGLPRLLKSYGFKSHVIPRLRGRDENEIIYTLTDNDWSGNGFHRR